MRKVSIQKYFDLICSMCLVYSHNEIRVIIKKTSKITLQSLISLRNVYVASRDMSSIENSYIHPI